VRRDGGDHGGVGFVLTPEEAALVERAKPLKHLWPNVLRQLGPAKGAWALTGVVPELGPAPAAFVRPKPPPDPHARCPQRGAVLSGVALTGAPSPCAGHWLYECLAFDEPCRIGNAGSGERSCRDCWPTLPAELKVRRAD
jgi:hypothetical protein